MPVRVDFLLLQTGDPILALPRGAAQFIQRAVKPSRIKPPSFTARRFLDDGTSDQFDEVRQLAQAEILVPRRRVTGRNTSGNAIAAVSFPWAGSVVRSRRLNSIFLQGLAAARPLFVQHSARICFNRGTCSRASRKRQQIARVSCAEAQTADGSSPDRGLRSDVAPELLRRKSGCSIQARTTSWRWQNRLHVARGCVSQSASVRAPIGVTVRLSAP